MKVPLYRHNLHGADIEEIGEEFKQVLRSMILTTGPVCLEMQDKLALYLNVKHCLLTNNWTNATMAVLVALDIGPGDEVIIPAMTFSATAQVIESVGATPVLVDIDPLTKLIDIQLAVAAITEKTKAVMPVHLYGQMVDMEALRNAIPPHIRILEDAAQVIDGSYDGKQPGAFSDAAMFSFYASKNITTGEGGAMVTNDDALLAKFTTIYRHGVDLDGFKRHVASKLEAPDTVSRGLKGNMPDTQALLLRPQLANINESHAQRKAHAHRYLEELGDLPIELPYTMPKAEHAWHIFAIGVAADKRAGILNELDARGIRTTIHFKPIHALKYFDTKYGYCPGQFIHSMDWGNRTLSLPVFSDLREDEQSYVIENLRQVLTK